jgi:hypothetical protein
MRTLPLELKAASALLLPLFTVVRGRWILGNAYAASCIEHPRSFEKVSLLASRESGPNRNI